MANSNGWGDGSANNAIGWGQGANNAIGWGDIHADSWAGLTDIVGVTTDPDAQAFITAASITDPTQQAAINQLVVDLKGYSIWSKFSALYPFVGGTASTHKFNLKNPLDTNAAFRLLFNGGGTHSVNGYQTNGLNAFADTNYNPFNNLSDINSNHISIYSRTNNQGGIDMGGGPIPLVDLELNYAATSFNWNMAANFSHTNSNSLGFYINTRTASNSFKLIKNGSTVLGSSTGAAGTTKPNANYHIGKRNLDTLWTNRQYAFASIGDGLTDAEALNFYTAVQAFQTTLGRSIGTQTVSDADAQAFVTNAGIVDQVEANAVNNLVIGLKADSLWTKMKAVYPFVGGTATSHSYNLVNTAQHQITWNGGVTHASTGVTFNGTNGYGNTNLSPSSILTKDSNSISFYNRKTIGQIGYNGVGTPNWFIFGKWLNIEYFPNASSNIQYASNFIGFTTGTRRTSTDVELYFNGASVATGSISSLNLPSNNFWLGGVNNGGSLLYPTDEQLAFAHLGDGLTDTEALNFYTAVQAFQTTLGRQV